MCIVFIDYIAICVHRLSARASRGSSSKSDEIRVLEMCSRVAGKRSIRWRKLRIARWIFIHSTLGGIIKSLLASLFIARMCLHFPAGRFVEMRAKLTCSVYGTDASYCFLHFGQDSGPFSTQSDDPIAESPFSKR